MSVLVRRVLIFLHRWLGVALCLVFLLWFPSGIAMMYWGFPTVTAADRLVRSPALDPTRVTLSAAAALERIGEGRPAQVHLNTFDGRPIYRFRFTNEELNVYADTGEEQTGVSRSMMDRIAAAWTRQPANAARVEPLREVDQWTIQGQFSNSGPLWKYTWPNGEELYISQTSGEVVQYTTRGSRLGAYVGAIPHWLYFAPLRKHGREWNSIVIWSSGIGTIAALIGIAIGIWMYSPSRRYRMAGVLTSIPYRGQKRWHMIFGLIFGVGAATWASSGMLSMDPFPSLTSGPNGDAGVLSIQRALRSQPPLTAFNAKSPRQALVEVGSPVKELELTTGAGTPVYVATLASGDTRIVPLFEPPQETFDRARVIDIIRRSTGSIGLSDVRVIDQYDRYYGDRRRQRPLPVIRAQLDDPWQTRVYVDPKTARVVAAYGSSGWVERWLYHALHSLDFPWLYNYRPLWDIVVITFMVGGTALCVTALVLAWRVLGRQLARLRGAPHPPALEGELAAPED